MYIPPDDMNLHKPHQTKNGIYPNIDFSTYYYSVGDYCFYFSSERNREKFEERWEEYVYDFNAYWSGKMKIEVILSSLALLELYQRIEKRGFRVEIKGERVWLTSLTLSGEIKTVRKSHPLFVHSIPNVPA